MPYFKVAFECKDEDIDTLAARLTQFLNQWDMTVPPSPKNNPKRRILQGCDGSRGVMIDVKYLEGYE